MGSERLRRATVAACALGLMGCAGAAVWQLDSPRLLVLFALVALVFGVMAWRALAQLGAGPLASAADPAFGRKPADDLAALQREVQLEQAPVALWWQAGEQIEPLNTAARRLLAPGAAQDGAQLLQQLREASQQTQLLSFSGERGLERCLLAIRPLTLAGQEARLLALMPVESELEAENLRAWRQLVHVLTHEIMNSLTPIASLSRTAQEMVDDPEARQDLTLALDTIARRAESLARFVANYREVSELPAPVREPVLLADLFARLEQLVAADWRARGGSASFSIEPLSLTLMADAGQLEQALLNLIRNAAQATAELAEPRLALHARLIRGGRLNIELRDNGPGVPPGLEADIFLPFFSTRPGGDSKGIGLAVVRNLVHGMGGTVRCVKAVGGGGVFVLSF